MAGGNAFFKQYVMEDEDKRQGRKNSGGKDCTMGTTQPIRDRQDLKRFMRYYLTESPSPRNYAMVILGLHSALRISDILNLKWEMLYQFEKGFYFDHLLLYEKKTGKKSCIALNECVKEALERHRQSCVPKPGHFVFSKKTSPNEPLSRSQAYRVIKKAAAETLLDPHISCHSLRKTFGYHAFKQGTPPALLMDIFNHSSFDVTKRYLGIRQDERDSIFLTMDFS